jgi:hypothetical protein
MDSFNPETNFIINLLEQNIFLYGDKNPKNLDLEQIAKYLKEFGFSVSIRGDFMKFFNLKNIEYAEKLAKIRIIDTKKKDVLNENPINLEVEEEIEIMKGTQILNILRPYEGLKFANSLKEHVDNGLHIIFTSRTLLIWSDRYHGKTIVIDPPITVVSTTGIIEAPAKPRKYYSQLMNYHRTSQLNLPIPYPSEEEFIKDLKKQLKGTFIDYDDDRLTEVAKGFAIQGIIYSIFGEPFCDDLNCRLFNAHTQKDLLISQLGENEFCSKHKKLIEYIKKMNDKKRKS